MRARRSGIAVFLVLVLLGATGCGDDGEDEAGVDAGGVDEGEVDEGEVDEGEGSTLSSYADAEAIAEALGCADTFRIDEAPEGDPSMPSPTSIGFCGGLGEESMLEVYADDDMAAVRAAVSGFACQIVPGFTWVVGDNWLVTPPDGESAQAEYDQLAATLGGELLACD
jgi:hypothetical protein